MLFRSVASRSDDGGGLPADQPPPSGASAPATSPKGGDSGAARALAYYLGLTAAIDRLLLTGQTIAPLTDWTIPTFPLKGGQIVARGIKAGPDVARILKAVEAQWVAEGFPSEERVAGLLDDELSGQ